MAKHNWVLDENGKPDEWAWESGFHNGVICQDCGFSPCIHCDEDWYEMDDCPGPRVKKPQTNADRIRAMSDEELALQLIEYRDDWGDYCTHKGCYDSKEEALKAEIEWLKQPADGDDKK